MRSSSLTEARIWAMDPLLGPELRRLLRTASIIRVFFAFTGGAMLGAAIVVLILGYPGWAIVFLLAAIGCGSGWVLYADRVDSLQTMEWDLRLTETPDDDD